MSYFLFEGTLSEGEEQVLAGEEAHHLLNGRRIRIGEGVELQDSTHQHFLVTVQKVSRKEVFFKVESQVEPPPPSPLELELVIGLPKEKALDLIIQKATELGATRLAVFVAHYSPKGNILRNSEKLLQRWKKVSQAACKQSGRQLPMAITLHKNLQAYLVATAPPQHQWCLTVSAQESAKPLPHLLTLSQTPSASHRVLIGPEGGLHGDEVQLALETHMHPLHLGPRILRTETAVIAIISILQHLVGDMKNA